MEENLNVLVDECQISLNDVLVDLDSYGQPFTVLVEGFKFELDPYAAESYIMEYGRENYSQMVCGTNSLSDMRKVAYESGEVVKELK